MNNVIANCIGYAFEQCYSSGVAITQDLTCDAAQLNSLKALVDAFEHTPHDDNIMWHISEEDIHKVKEAKTLQDLR